MFCYSSACNEKPLGDFICNCNQKKFFCQKHENGISEQKRSCQVGWKCLLCLEQAVTPHLRFITIFSKNDVPFMVCSDCAILAIDHWIAKYIEQEKENVCTVEPAREGSVCDKCSETIIAVRPFESNQNTKRNGWVWSDGLLKHRYCVNCIGEACI